MIGREYQRKSCDQPDWYALNQTLISGPFRIEFFLTSKFVVLLIIEWDTKERDTIKRSVIKLRL